MNEVRNLNKYLDSANQSTSSNEEVDTFVNVTVPALNAFVAQMTRPQQLNMAGSMEETKKDLEKSMPNFVKKLSDFYAAQRFLEQVRFKALNDVKTFLLGLSSKSGLDDSRIHSKAPIAVPESFTWLQQSRIN